MFRIAELRGWDEALGLEAQWEELYKRTQPGATIFQSPAWVRLWYEHLAPTADCRIFTIRASDGRLVGVAPCSLAVVGPLGIRLLCLLGRPQLLTEYFDALIDPRCGIEAARSLVSFWHQGSHDWHFVCAGNLLEDSFLRQALSERAHNGHRMIFERRPRMARALPGDWPTFYQSLSKSMKDNVNNYVNRLRRDGHEDRLVVACTGSELDLALDNFLELHRKRSESPLKPAHRNRFGTAESRTFLREVAHRLLSQQAIWVCQLMVDAQPVAVQMWLVQGRRMYRYYSGFDPEWARYGVMTVLTRRCIERAIDNGITAVDFLLDNSQSLEKQRWGAVAGDAWYIVTPTRPRSRLILAAHVIQRRLREASENVCRRLVGEGRAPLSMAISSPWRG